MIGQMEYSQLYGGKPLRLRKQNMFGENSRLHRIICTIPFSAQIISNYHIQTHNSFVTIVHHTDYLISTRYN